MKLGYTIIYVPDVVKTVEFYETAFGLARRFVNETGQYAEMETGATTLAFADEAFVRESHDFTPTSPRQPGPGVEIGFIAEDVAQAFNHAVQVGAEPLVAPKVKPWGQTVSYVRDSNGFIVEICSALG